MTFMTETISTVGYGVHFEPNALEKLFIISVIFLSMNTLILLFNQVKELKVIKPLSQFIKANRKELEEVIG